MADGEDMQRPNCFLPPSPNWYCSSAAECSIDGVYAFTAKSNVFVLDINSEPPAFRGQFTEHGDRVSAVCSSRSASTKLFASTSDDKTVKIWNVDSKSVLASHNIHRAKITCVCWASASSELIISGDEKGAITAWDYSKNLVYSACPEQEYIFCISASNHSEHALAVVGYKNGLIVVIKEDDEGISVKHRLRGHDSDVHCLAWSPVSVDGLQLGDLQEKVQESQGNLVISGSRDQTIRLWDALNGKVLSILNLPKRTSQKWKDRHDWQSKDRLWLALCWPKRLPNKFISSSHSGELLLWDVNCFSGSDKFQFFSQGHSRIVFNICCNDEGTRAVSCSMDRQIIVWDMKTLQSVHCICTLGGFAYGLDISPLDPGTVAVGVGDNMIRIWHTMSPVSVYDSVTLWQGIKAKVQVVSWHPSKEGVLAFGTDSGQVGIYNTVSKKPSVFASYHKTTVYSLSWGPPCPELKDKGSDALHVYSCSGDGSVLQHKPNQPLQDSINVNKLIQSSDASKRKVMSCTDISWNCNLNVLAVGNQDGTIEVFAAPLLTRLCTISVHKKSITYLAWHPGYGDDTSEDECRLPYRLASASNETTIHIHDLGSVIHTDDSKTITTITTSHRKLVGHSGRVTSLCWSPHHRDMIVSASYDGTAQVWNVETSQGIGNYRGHIGRLLSVQWSFVDADVVYSGGEDGSVRSWSIKEQTFTHPPAASTRTSKPKKKSKSKSKDPVKPVSIENEEETIQTEASITENKTNAIDVNENENKKDSLPQQELSWRRPETIVTAGSSTMHTNAHDSTSDERVFVAATDNDDAASISSLSTQESGPTVIVSKTKGDTSKKKRKLKSMFPLSAVADNNTRATVQQDCIALAQHISQKDSTASPIEVVTPGESSDVHLGLFADRTCAYKMFEAEGLHHSSANNLDYQLQLEIWKGNLGSAIEKAKKAKQLSDWLVAMSALGGRDVWLNTVECYADQLKSEGSHQRAVLYYLACHKVYDAIDVFKNQAMYREAIALAKVRLSPSDPVLHDLYCAWAKKLETEHYENAAKCYLAAGLANEAVRVLSIRGDKGSLTTALKVAVVSGLSQLASSLAVRVMYICMGTGNWLAAEDCLTSCIDIEGHQMVLYTHEILVDVFLQQGVIPDSEFKEQVHSKDFNRSYSGAVDEIIGKIQTTPCQDSPWAGSTMTQSRDWLISRILKAWDRVGMFSLKTPCAQSFLDQMSTYLQSNLNDNLSLKQILIRIAYDISLGLVQGIQQHYYSSSLPWLQTLESCIKNNYFVLAQSLCVHLLPRGSQSLDDISNIRGKYLEGQLEDANCKRDNPECKRDYSERIRDNLECKRDDPDCKRDDPEPERDASECKGDDPECIQNDPECESKDSTKKEKDFPKGILKQEDEMQQNICSAKMFSYFISFYSLVELYERWWRASHLLENIDLESNSSEDRTVMSGFSREFTGSIVPFNVARKVANDLNPSNATVNNTRPDDNDTALSKQPLPALLKPDEILPLSRDLLHKDVFLCVSLKEQLLEIKKEMILLRSRRILDSVAAASLSKQKRAVKKKGKEKEAIKDDAKEEESMSSSSCQDSQVKENDKTGVQCSHLTEPLDVRYKSNDWTLERLQDEEQRLLQELANYSLKDLPFPDPVESSIVIAHVCLLTNNSSCYEPAVQCGLNAVTCGLDHAQWAWQQKALDELQQRLREKLPISKHTKLYFRIGRL